MQDGRRIGARWHAEPAVAADPRRQLGQVLADAAAAHRVGIEPGELAGGEAGAVVVEMPGDGVERGEGLVAQTPDRVRHEEALAGGQPLAAQDLVDEVPEHAAAGVDLLSTRVLAERRGRERHGIGGTRRRGGRIRRLHGR